MLISVSQNPRGHPQMSCFFHNGKILCLLSYRSKETRQDIHIIEAGIKEFGHFFLKNESK